MTPRAPSKERVEELGKKLGMAEGSERWLGEQIRLSESEANDLLAILDDYSAMRAENEELVGECENWEDSFKRVNAQLEKQRPLVEEAMCLSEADAEMGEVGGLVRAALKLREEGK